MGPAMSLSCPPSSCSTRVTGSRGSGRRQTHRQPTIVPQDLIQVGAGLKVKDFYNFSLVNTTIYPQQFKQDFSDLCELEETTVDNELSKYGDEDFQVLAG